MYAINRTVWVKDEEFVGQIVRRDWVGEPRRARYVVRAVERAYVPMVGTIWKPTGYECVCVPSNLRAADYQCEDCNRWLPISTQSNHPEIAQCFLCRRADIAEWDGRVSMPQGWWRPRETSTTS